MDYRSRWQQRRRERAVRLRLILIVAAVIAAVFAIISTRGVARPAPAGYQLLRPDICWLAAIEDGILVTTRSGMLIKLTPDLAPAENGWSEPYTSPAGLWGRAAVADGNALIGGADVRLRAIDLTTALAIWEVEVGGAVPGVTVSGGEVFFGSDLPAIFSVTTAGVRRWSRPLDDHSASPPLVTDDAIITGTLAGQVCALDRRDGSLLWCLETGAPIFAPPRMGPSSILVGDDAGLLHSVTPAGDLLFSLEMNGVIRHAAGISGGVLVVGDSSGLLLRINPADMTEIWRRRLPGPLAAEPVIVGDVVWVGAGEHLLALRVESGATICERVAEAETSDVIAAHGRIYWATTNGRVRAVNCDD